MKVIMLIIGFTLLLASCGKANSDDSHAEVIASPKAGYSCFVIYSGGQAVGGNCVKE
jgi:ABC-type Zn uptake system ZnuABC Zn-binding protein ZnuA